MKVMLYHSSSYCIYNYIQSRFIIYKGLIEKKNAILIRGWAKGQLDFVEGILTLDRYQGDRLECIMNVKINQSDSLSTF